MKRLLIASLFFLLPLSAFAVPEKKEQRETLGESLSFMCPKYGEESCIARFLAMEACTFMIAMNSGKPPYEAWEIASDMFALTMQGNNLEISSMYNESGKIKPAIKSEAIERIGFCREKTKEAMPILYKARKGKDSPPEMIEGLTATYGVWFLKSIEDVGVGKQKKEG
tara:strand:- start:245 stop:748 length:504 start_codon:yes stop_codon:yes gene_type:complete